MATEGNAPAAVGAQDDTAAAAPAAAAPVAPAAPAAPPAVVRAAARPAPAAALPSGGWFVPKHFPMIDAETGTHFMASVPTYGVRTKWVEMQVAAGGLLEVDAPAPKES